MKDKNNCWYWYSPSRQFWKENGVFIYNSTENNKIQSPNKHRNTTEQETVMITQYGERP